MTLTFKLYIVISCDVNKFFAADNIFLSKQRDVLRLFSKVHEPNQFKEQAEVGRSYDPTQHLSKYKVR
jgi:hypothetical protein